MADPINRGNTRSIFARDLQPYDVWLGEDTELEILTMHVVTGQTFIPWKASRHAPPVPMDAIVITGEIIREGQPPYTGTWTLQEDQPLEVRRGHAKDVQ